MALGACLIVFWSASRQVKKTASSIEWSYRVDPLGDHAYLDRERSGNGVERVYETQVRQDGWLEPVDKRAKFPYRVVGLVS